VWYPPADICANERDQGKGWDPALRWLLPAAQIHYRPSSKLAGRDAAGGISPTLIDVNLSPPCTAAGVGAGVAVLFPSLRTVRRRVRNKQS
jgi:hypothetical protein